MKKNFKNICCFFLSIFLIADSYAQNDVLSLLQSRLTEYNQKLLPEKLYVHTDKNFYVTGDIIWFKIYAVDGFFNKPLALSKVAYVEILDKTNTPVLRSKIELNEKSGNGSLQLPISLSSGNYTLRAYTNWMKNLGANQFFEKTITVVNPFKSLMAQEEKATSYVLNIFPEGGNLVRGLLSRIAYKLTDKYGKSVNAKGFLLNENNDTLSTFTPFKFGMGSFDLVPEANHSYRVLFVTDDRQLISKHLPNAYENGSVISVEDEGEKIKTTVRTNDNSQNEVFLIVQARQVISVAKRAKLDYGLAVFYVDKSSLAEGVSQFTVFNNNKQPVCERLFFNQPSAKSLVNIHSNKKVYSTREKISLAMDSLAQTNASLSVYKIDSLQKPETSDILTYLWLESELNGPVEQPQYYFSSSDNEVKKAADYLMLTQGWRRFKWEDILNSNPLIKFPVEASGHTIIGKVVDTRANTVAPNVDVYLSIPDSKYKLYFDQSDSNGLVNFKVSDYYGPGEVIMQTNEQDSFYHVELLSPFSEEYTTHNTSQLSILPDEQKLLENYSIAMQAQNIYKADSIRKFSAPEIPDTLLFFGKGQYSYNLDDYTRFSTMEEVLREYVREINVGTSEGLKIKLLNEDQKTLFSDNILVVVDGVPYFNTHKIFSLDPLKFKRIDVISKDYLLGSKTFYALASFSTYQGNYEGLDLDPKAIAIDYEGLQLKREFYSPDYSVPSQQKSRLPDLRNTLLWMPDVSSNNIQFFSGDTKGKFLVVLQGINAEGKPITASSEFEVK